MSNHIGHIIIETDLSVDNIGKYNGKSAKKVKEHGGHVVMEAVIQSADTQNRNRRIYPREDLFKELSSPRTMELLKTGNMKGENGHPTSTDLTRQQKIDPNNTAIVFTKFWTEDNLVLANYYADFNSIGDDLDRQIRNGQIPSFSLRALGNIVAGKKGTEVRGTKLITYDRVIYPSHPEAYTRGFVYESTIIDNELFRCQEGSKIILDINDKGLIIPISESAMDYIKTESSYYKELLESDSIQVGNNNKISMYKDPYTKSSYIRLKDDNNNKIQLALEDYIFDEVMKYGINK